MDDPQIAEQIDHLRSSAWSRLEARIVPVVLETTYHSRSCAYDFDIEDPFAHVLVHSALGHAMNMVTRDNANACYWMKASVCWCTWKRQTSAFAGHAVRAESCYSFSIT